MGVVADYRAFSHLSDPGQKHLSDRQFSLFDRVFVVTNDFSGL